MKLSVVIPAHNEEGCIRGTVEALVARLGSEAIPHEILVVNDNSRDRTESVLRDLVAAYPSVRYVNNTPPNGFGFAVRRGLREFTGDAVAVYMADASDDPEDLVRFYRKLCEGYDCVFGTRWRNGGRTYDYPLLKRIMNRLANQFVRMLFQVRYDDMTNAFKLYRREVIHGVQPLLSHHFNLTVEIPLKAITRGYTFKTSPISWQNRKYGVAKLKIKEMGSRYFFICAYVWLEKYFSRGDYRRKNIHGN